jgi:hypothetical protein
MQGCLSPAALSSLEAFRFWLRHSVPEWDISLPKDEIVETGKEYPPFHLYCNGVSVAMVESPIEALEKIGNVDFLENYVRLITEDPDAPTV